MKTAIRLTSVVMAVAFCASAFAAEPSKPVKKATRKVCYTYITGSAIAQPCDRITGAIPTTASQLYVIGNNSGSGGR
jgi:hypothetical protein